MKEKKIVDIRSTYRLYLLKFKNLYQRVKKRQETESGLDVQGDEDKLVSCLNCGCEYHGAYCPSCGQEADTERYTVKSVCKNLFETLIGGDSIFLRTCVQLVRRPGYMIHDFLVGKRTRYFKPVQMLLCLVTIYALLSYALGDSIMGADDLDLTMQNPETGESLAKASKLLSDFFSNRVLYSLTSALGCVLPYQWLFHRCKITWPDGKYVKLNVAEQFYVLIYLSCQYLICGFLLLPFMNIPAVHALVKTLSYILPILLYIWTYKQLYKISWWKSAWKNIVAMMLSWIILMCLIVVYFLLSLLLT